MTTIATSVPPPPPQDIDPWLYGWRYVPQTLPDGSVKLKQVPLSLRDVLHPQEEDFIVQSDPHDDDCAYLKATFKSRFRDNPEVVVLSDCRVDFNVPGVEPLGPDAVVIEGVRTKRGWATFYMAEENTRPLLVVEVTSPSTRKNDLEDKVKLYHRAGVPWYVIADADEGDDHRTLTLIGYRHTPQGYVKYAPNERGWLWLEPVKLWLGSDNGLVACYDAQGNKIGDYSEVSRARQVAEAQAAEERVRAQAAESHAQAEAEARQAAETRVQAAQSWAQAEAEARQAAEAHAQAEAEARQAAESYATALAETRQAAESLAQAEAYARQATEAQVAEARAKAQTEAEVRQLAEAHAKAEAEARRVMEVRLQEMEAELRRLRGEQNPPQKDN